MITQQTKINIQIDRLKRKLAKTNEQAIMFAVGELTAEEYAETKAQRKAWREEINTLEAQLQAMQATE